MKDKTLNETNPLLIIHLKCIFNTLFYLSSNYTCYTVFFSFNYRFMLFASL